MLSGEDIDRDCTTRGPNVMYRSKAIVVLSLKVLRIEERLKDIWLIM